MSDLPAELWTKIFDLAADEDVIFQLGLPTVMAESAWFKNFYGEWALRSPEDALALVQRRSYATKKAIVRTCKKWRSLGSEFVYRSLVFNDPTRLLTLCRTLDSSSATTTSTASLGWWTRRVHLTRYYANFARGATWNPVVLQDALISIIRHCPNLETFVVEGFMVGSTFGPIADALAIFTSKSLRTLHISVPSSALPKVIWALDSLPNVFAAYIELRAATPDEDLSAPDDTHLDAARNIHLRLPALQQLSLRGHVQGFLEQATGWSLPSLRHLSIDYGTQPGDLPDTLAFLTAHGAQLLFLDVNSFPAAMPLPRILVACPSLTTLAFNADWRIVVPEDADAEANTPPLAHERLTSVGLHGLTYAFDVGRLRTKDPLATSANDRAVTALCDRARFPALRRIRALSRTVLHDLDRANGPGPDGGMERWERWWEACRRADVRLEDCTGGLLGDLPQDEPEAESESDEDEDEVEYEDQESEFQIVVTPLAPEGGLEELRQLLEECRAMDEGRDDNYMYTAAGFPDSGDRA